MRNDGIHNSDFSNDEREEKKIPNLRKILDFSLLKFNLNNLNLTQCEMRIRLCH